MIVVIPTCRGVNLHHLAPLIDHGCRFIVVDDSPGSFKIDHPLFEVYSWPDRRRLLGENEVAIPRGNGACRNLGFYLAWKEGDPDEIVIALDDDCAVVSPGFVDHVRSVLGEVELPVVSGSGRHFNIFDLYDDPSIRSQFPRGFPYSARMGYESWNVDHRERATVGLNLGLWSGVLDINAVDRLAAETEEYPDARLRFDNVLVPSGALISVCSGSMQFRRSLIPAIYQLPMNVAVLGEWTINRFGDIWGGFILKSLMDRRGDRLTVGGPLVHHARVGPAAMNARREHLAHLIHEELIDLLCGACREIEPDGYLEMMTGLRQQLARLGPRTTPILGAYLRELDTALRAWLSALGARGQ